MHERRLLGDRTKAAAESGMPEMRGIASYHPLITARIPEDAPPLKPTDLFEVLHLNRQTIWCEILLAHPDNSTPVISLYASDDWANSGPVSDRIGSRAIVGPTTVLIGPSGDHLERGHRILRRELFCGTFCQVSFILGVRLNGEPRTEGSLVMAAFNDFNFVGWAF